MNINEMLENRIKIVNDKMHHILSGNDGYLNGMVDWVLSEKGKQLRPKFLLAAAIYCDKDKDVTEYAAILELIHIATLVHDDVIDNSFFRRGKMSVYKKYGTKAAVYLGDYIIFSIFKNSKKEFNDKFAPLIECIQKLCDGELGQNSKLYDLSITINDYLKNIEGKTASLFELATKAGVILCDAEDVIIKKFEGIGKNFGILFQINDDLIDLSLDESYIGKPIFQDFCNGIYTLPIILSKCYSNNYQKLLYLQDDIKKYGMTNEIKSTLLQILVQANAFGKTYQIASKYYEEGKNLITSLENCDIKKYFLNKYDELIESIMRKCKDY